MRAFFLFFVALTPICGIVGCGPSRLIDQSAVAPVSGSDTGAREEAPNADDLEGTVRDATVGRGADTDLRTDLEGGNARSDSENGTAGAKEQEQGQEMEQKQDAIVDAALAERRSLHVSVNFDFNRATLSSKSRRDLTSLLKRMSESDRDALAMIRVVGFADRLGADAYNLALSYRRAEAVRDFLVASSRKVNAGGANSMDSASMVLSSANIHIEALGESRPLSIECAAIGDRDKLIECLWRDRRADVMVEFVVSSRLD